MSGLELHKVRVAYRAWRTLKNYTDSLHSLSTQTLYTDALHRHLSPSNPGTGGATRDLSLCGVRPLRPPAVKKGTQQALVPFAAAATVPLVVNHVHVSHESE